MVTAPRPLAAISASIAAAGPNAMSVTMRRSKLSAWRRRCLAPSGGLKLAGRGQTNIAAMNSMGSMKKSWPPAKNAGCRM